MTRFLLLVLTTGEVSACGAEDKTPRWHGEPTICVSLEEPWLGHMIEAGAVWEAAGAPRIDWVIGDTPGGLIEDGLNTVAEGDPSGERYAETRWITRGDRIVEADIIVDLVVNDGVQECYAEYGFRKIALHELGHFWGLFAHSENPEAVMWGESRVCEGLRELHEEDIERIEELYQ